MKAALDAAAAVAGEQSPVLGFGRVPDLATEVEDDAARVQQPLQVRLFGEVPHDVSGDAIPVGGDTGFVGGAGERVGVDGDQDRRPFTPTGHRTRRVRRTQLDQSVGQSLFGRALVAVGGFAADERDHLVELA